MESYLTPDGALYINKTAVTEGSSGSAEFLDEEHKVLGVVASYDIFDMDIDLSQENEYQIVFRQIGFEDGVKGNWEFAFRADGRELIADTKRISMEKEFELPDGVKITLKEFTSNDLEQRISYELSGPTSYILMVKAEDSLGSKVEFGVRSQDAASGYMQNEEIIEDGRLNGEANAVTMTLYAVKLPEENGRISDDYVPIGDSFELEL